MTARINHPELAIQGHDLRVAGHQRQPEPLGERDSESVRVGERVPSLHPSRSEDQFDIDIRRSHAVPDPLDRSRGGRLARDAGLNVEDLAEVDP